MLTKHAIIWSIFTQICYFVAWKGSTVLACCIKIVHKISAFLSRYTATRQMHSKIVQERKRKEWFIYSLLCCKEKDLWGSSSLFFLGNHGIKVTTTHFPGMSKRSWLTECHSNLFSFRGMIALKRRDSVDLETTTYQVDRALRDRRKKLVKRNTIADFYKHDVNSDSGTNGEWKLFCKWF